MVGVSGPRTLLDVFCPSPSIPLVFPINTSPSVPRQFPYFWCFFLLFDLQLTGTYPPPPASADLFVYAPMPLLAYLRTISRHQWLLLVVLALVGLCTSVTFSSIVPFLPGEAKKKGLDTANIGFIIGAYQLGQAIASPFFGKSMSFFNPNCLFSSGLCLTALGVVSFGILPLLPDAKSFFWTAISIRVLMALGVSANKISSSTLLAQTFPAQLASISGILDTFGAISYSSGPIIGSLLFQIGGFSLPFLVFGSLMFLCSLLSFYLLYFRPSSSSSYSSSSSSPPAMSSSSSDDEEKEGAVVTAGLFAILRVPKIALVLLGIASFQLACFFYDASLAEHVAKLNNSKILAGLLISVTATTCMVSAPLWGFLVDRFSLAEPIMLTGSVMAMVFALILGPSPLLPGFPLTISTAIGAFVLQGMAITAFSIPSLKYCIQAAKTSGGFQATSAATCGCVAGLLQCFFGFGAFFGNILGGLFVQWIGFEWTATLAAFAQIPFILGMFLFCTGKSLRRKFLGRETEQREQERRCVRKSSNQSTDSDRTQSQMINAI